LKGKEKKFLAKDLYWGFGQLLLYRGEGGGILIGYKNEGEEKLGKEFYSRSFYYKGKDLEK